MENRIENKLDKLSEDVSEIKTTLAAQHEQIKIHIKRTDTLEADLKEHKKTDALLHDEFKSYMDVQKGMMKILTFIMTVPTVVVSVILIVKSIKG